MRYVEEGPLQGAYQPITLLADRGDVSVRFYPVPAETRLGAIWVGGAGGGWDTPARYLYPTLSEALRADGIASLRVRFRNPTHLEEAAHDVAAGIAFLEGKGIDTIALTGHSLGGAVVIQAAARAPSVRTVVTLATQSYGVDPAARLGPRCALLLLHGTADRILPARCSEYTYAIAQEPKRLRLLPGADHVLDEAAEDVHQEVRGWVRTYLLEAAAPDAP